MFKKTTTVFADIYSRIFIFFWLSLMFSHLISAQASYALQQQMYSHLVDQHEDENKNVMQSVGINNNVENAAEKNCAKKGLLKPAMIFYEIAHKQILDALKEINQNLAYWHRQKAHPLSYFFHKSPTKWMFGSKQSDEIPFNINFLQERQVKLYTMLGKLVGHVDECLPDAPLADQYVWIEKLLDIISFIDEDGIMTANHADKITTRLRNSLKIVGSLKEKIMSDCAHVQRLHHFVTNWMLYTVATAGVGYAGYYGYNNAGIIKQSVNDLVDKLSEKYNEFKSREPFFNEQAAKNDYEAAKEEIDTFVRAEYQARNITEKLGNEILNDLPAGGLKGLHRHLLSLSSSGKIGAVYNLGGTIKVAELFAGHLIFRTMYLLSCIEKGVYDVCGKAAVVIPVLGGLWGMKKLYQWTTHCDYSPIRVALAHVNSVFIESGSDTLNDHDRGKLVYFLAQLKDKTVRYLSSHHNEYHEFLADSEKLGSSTFSLHAKQAMIDNMYKRYVFLSVI